MVGGNKSLSKEKLVIFGAGGHAKVIADLVEKISGFEIEAFVEKDVSKTKSFFGYPVVTEDEVFVWIQRKRVSCGVIAIGSNQLRARVAQNVESKFPNFRFVSLVHPAAQLGRGVQVGKGSVVFAGVVINSDTWIGNHCIVNTGACLDHDGKMEDSSSIGPGSILGGNVTVGKAAIVSLGVKISRGVQVGPNCVIGAGAVLLKNTDQVGLYYGVPATFQRSLT